MKNNPSIATNPSAIIVEYGDGILSSFLRMFILTPVSLDMTNDPKLSHGHRTVTPKCNRDNQISRSVETQGAVAVGSSAVLGINNVCLALKLSSQ